MSDKTPFLYLEAWETKITAPCGCELSDEDLEKTQFFMCDNHIRAFQERFIERAKP